VRRPARDLSSPATAIAAVRPRGAAREDLARDPLARDPLAPERPLWQLRQVVWTPHVSGVSPRRFWDRLAALFLENWRSYAEGRPLGNLVDKTLGY